MEQLGDHEARVEKFYSTGADKRAHQDEGFLSFGYWTNETQSYHQAALHLLNVVLGEIIEPQETSKILNVSCGYGAETFHIHNRLNPVSIVGLDLTHVHIEQAQIKAKKA